MPMLRLQPLADLVDVDTLKEVAKGYAHAPDVHVGHVYRSESGDPKFHPSASYLALLHTLRCEHCGGLFGIEGLLTDRRRFCTPECKQRRNRNSFAERPCASCGKPITGGKYCPGGACKQRAYRKRKRERT
jgi:hypothetical protein